MRSKFELVAEKSAKVADDGDGEGIRRGRSVTLRDTYNRYTGVVQSQSDFTRPPHGAWHV